MSEANRDEREGRLELVDGRWQLRFVRRLAHSREKVWRALTEAEHLAAWFPTTIEGERRPAARLRFAFPDHPDAPAEHGEMITYDPPSVLEFTWGGPPEGEPGEYEHVRFELTEDGGGCVLTFVTAYDAVGKSARDAAGWHVCLDLLEHALAGAKPDWKPEDRWPSLNRRYQERFGPEASAIGPPTG
jgi:uncharacterized protein YndB with AHSA1/START domain